METAIPEQARPVVKLRLLDGYAFNVSFPGTQGAELVMDEPEPLGRLRGPNASRVFASSIANCLSASLLFCLRKSRVEVATMEASAEPTVLRNEEGYWRVRRVDVRIDVGLKPPVDTERVNRCLGIFEKYCVVTGAVRNSVDVNVDVRTRSVREPLENEQAG